MDSLNLTTHPSTAQQAKQFTSAQSLSYPGGLPELTPPSSVKDGSQTNGSVNGQSGDASTQGNGVTPAEEAPAEAGLSGITPVLQ